MRSDRRARRDQRLPDDYYVQAFLTVLDVVAMSSASILTDAEQDWSTAIVALSDDAQRLYIRLMMRRGAHFRLERLRYPEITDLHAARDELVVRGLASDAPPDSLAALLPAFTLPELDRWLCLPAEVGRRRVERVAALLERDDPEDRRRLGAAARWLSPLGHAMFAVHRLCFFGNLRQDLSEFVLRDLGTVRYAGYAIDGQSSLFRTRHQLNCHLRYYECELLFDTCRQRDPAALQAICARLPPTVADDAPLQRRVDRLRCALARCFERLGDPSRALSLYADSVRPPARERHVRLLDVQGRHDEAVRLAQRMRDAPQGEAECEFAERRLGPRLGAGQASGQGSGQGSARRPRPYRPSTTSLTLRPDGRRVERVARDFYARRGHCYWTENRLLTGVCGLWAWDIVFAPIAGAFFNPFQSGPADFRERGFRQRRASAFAARFDELLGVGGIECLRDRVLGGVEAHRGTANPLVCWEALTLPMLERALERVPAAHWAVMFERLLDDPGEHGSGLPDLVSFPATGGYEFIEIKGPGDALQAHQRRWLRHFAQHDVPARVVSVRWARSGKRLVDVA